MNFDSAFNEFRRNRFSAELWMNCRFLYVAAHPEVRHLKEAVIHQP
jgi:hypothetical protein